MGIKEREWKDSSFGYRFGFQGQEGDDEVSGSGNSYDFGNRIYNPRLGNWFSLDPLMRKYPGYSAYSYCIGNPIFYVDPDGRDIEIGKIAGENGYRTGLRMLGSSNSWVGFVNQFANVNSGDNPYGASVSGSMNDVTIAFKITDKTSGEVGNQTRLNYKVNGQFVKRSDLKVGAVVEGVSISINVQELKGNTETSVGSGYSKTMFNEGSDATIILSHEALLHGLKMSQLIEASRREDGSIDYEKLMKLEDESGGEDSHHKELVDGEATLLESAISEVQNSQQVNGRTKENIVVKKETGQQIGSFNDKTTLKQVIGDKFQAVKDTYVPEIPTIDDLTGEAEISTVDQYIDRETVTEYE
jgi:RHS repeat-associated protein